MSLGRRRWLMTVALGLLSSSLSSPTLAQPSAKARIVRRWETGNSLLAPLAAANGLVLCGGDERLALFDPDTDQPRWQIAHALPGGMVFRPRIAGDVALCGGEEALGAWQLSTGKPLWRRPAEQQTGVACVHQGRVFVGDGHQLLCLDLHSGREYWRFAAVPDTLISYAAAAADNTLYVGPGDGRLYALDVSDGRLRWTLNHIEEWQYLRQLHVAGEVLVAGSYKEMLYGIDRARGEVLWRFNAGNFINSQHIANGVAYLWSPTGWLYAIDTRNGELRWRHRTTDYRGSTGNWASILAELVVLQDRLYALDLDNMLHILDATHGREVLRLKLPESVRPFVLPLAANRLMFGTQSGELIQVVAE